MSRGRGIGVLRGTDVDDEMWVYDPLLDQKIEEKGWMINEPG